MLTRRAKAYSSSCSQTVSLSWSRSINTGVWLRALGNGDQRRSMGPKAREGVYVFYVHTDCPGCRTAAIERYVSFAQITWNIILL